MKGATVSQTCAKGGATTGSSEWMAAVVVRSNVQHQQVALILDKIERRELSQLSSAGGPAILWRESITRQMALDRMTNVC